MQSVILLRWVQWVKSDNCMQVSELLKLVNDWFDVFNSKKFVDIPYGLNLTNQNKILNEMITYIEKLRVGNHMSLIPFQKGVILSSKSLQGLHTYLKEKYPQEMVNDRKQTYIFTNRLNQDVLENFFGYIRSMGALNVRPSALQFKYRLRWYLLAKHSQDLIVNNHNSEEDADESFVTISDGVGLPNSRDDDENYVDVEKDSENDEHVTDIMGTCFDIETEIIDPITDNIDEDAVADIDEEEDRTFECSDSELRQKIQDIIQEEALIYVAGYVAYRFRNKYPFLGTATKNIAINNIPPWICHVSRGYLKYPLDALIEVGKILETEFQNFHGNFLSDKTGIFQKVATLVENRLILVSFLGKLFYVLCELKLI